VTLRASGDWTLHNIGAIDARLTEDLEALDYGSVQYDLSGVTDMDTAGAFIFARAVRIGPGQRHKWSVLQGSKGQRTLMQAAADAVWGKPPREDRQWYDSLSRVGKATHRFLNELIETIAFIGKDLVGVSILRELAPIITAILIAGRSDSAFTAQIGAMKMRQEIDAMTVIGLDTFETLVVPRAIACLVALPILTFLGMLSGVFAGMLIAWLGDLDISPVLFLARLNEVVGAKSFWVGMVKTPFFAIIISVIGCRQGLAVTGSVESLGTRTTQSVVQSIFAVITVNAVFAILFYQMGI